MAATRADDGRYGARRGHSPQLSEGWVARSNARRPTGTDDGELRWKAAGRREGARAAERCGKGPAAHLGADCFRTWSADPRVDQLVTALSHADSFVPEQVIEVPRISLPPCRPRTALREQQTAEQLVEVPTVVSWSMLIPVPRGCGGQRLQGSLPVQSPAAQPVEQLVGIYSGGGLQGLRPGQGSTAFPGGSSQRTAAQIADIPVPGLGGSGCLLGSLPEQRTTALHVAQERISERTEQFDAGGDFPSRRAGPRVVRPRQGSAAAGAEQLADIVSHGPDHVDEHPSLVTPMARPTFGTGALVLRSGSRRRAPVSSGLARRVLEGRPGTGTRKHVPVHMTSLFFLLSEELHSLPRAVYKFWAPCRGEYSTIGFSGR